jgi:D-alanyl-D-alanine dipeptidase
VAGVTRRVLAVALVAAVFPSIAFGQDQGRGPVDGQELRRAGLRDVRDYAPDVQLDIRYATRENFTGSRLPGYCRPWAFLRRRAARALGRAEERLADDGYGLRVFDAYRPARATRAMVRWARRTGRAHLLGRYIASRSNHNRGVAIDLTLVRLSTGRPVDMGTPFDAFTTRAHTLNARGGALRNRLRLRSAMNAAGFANYHREWWHYDYRGDPRARPLDVTLGC